MNLALMRYKSDCEVAAIANACDVAYEQAISDMRHREAVAEAIKSNSPLPTRREADAPICATNNTARHLGPMAEAFNRAFGVNGESADSITLGDGIGVALRAIQELADIVDDLKAEIAELRAALKLPEKPKKTSR